jgi:hypothetical protein
MLSLLKAAVIAVAALLLLGLVTASPAQAASAIRFSKIYFDSPGSDRGSNSSLNDEWVRITNYGSRSRDLTGWTIKDRTGYKYTFPSFRLGAGDSVRVHTGHGIDTQTNLYWDKDWYVWNNAGDTAFLRNRNVERVDRCVWDGTGSYTYCR